MNILFMYSSYALVVSKETVVWFYFAFLKYFYKGCVNNKVSNDR